MKAEAVEHKAWENLRRWRKNCNELNEVNLCWLEPLWGHMPKEGFKKVERFETDVVENLKWKWDSNLFRASKFSQPSQHIKYKHKLIRPLAESTELFPTQHVLKQIKQILP